MRADAEAIAAGSWLPGWQLSFMPLDTSRRSTPTPGGSAWLYVSVALAGIGVIASSASPRAGVLRRHLQLARLKTDLVAAASHELRTPLASMRVLVDGLLADERARSDEDARVSRAAGRRERAPEPADRELPHLLAARARPAPVRLRARRIPSAIVAAAVDAVRDRLPR